MIDPNTICMNCMKELSEPKGVCQHCGFDNASCENAAHQLECGSILAGSYLVGRVLGQGGFGITYVGMDLNLDLKVAIKEYYPEGSVTRDTHTHVTVLTYAGEKDVLFQKGKERFVAEAKTLAKFAGDSGIVGVRSFFFENGTAYIVMDYIEGETLKAYATRRGRLPVSEALTLFRPLMRSLARVHEIGLLHRDISPDNIMLKRDGTLMLLDFGAARQMSVTGEHSNTINVKHGFAPEEQYRTRGEQGSWTDVYALAATLYRLTTGEMPPQALDRLTNEAMLTPPNQLGANFSPAQERALLRALAVRAADRTQSMAQFESELYGDAVYEIPSRRVPDRTSDKPVRPAPYSGPAQGAVAQFTQNNPPVADAEKVKKQKRGLKIGLIAAGAMLVVFLIWSIVGGGGGKEPARDANGSGGIVAKISGGTKNAGEVIEPTNEPADEQTAEPTTEPTAEPIVDPDPVTITLGYGETYQCTVRDFNLPDSVGDADVTWPDLTGIAGVYCDNNGWLVAGNVQFDPANEYNDDVTIEGKTSNGATLTYNVRVGDGQSYSFNWSESPRNLKSVNGYTFIATPQVENSTGFTVVFGYDLEDGEINGTNWSVWVHENGTEWAFIQDITVNEGEYTEYVIDFNRTISFTEFIIQPPKEYNYFRYSNSYKVTSIIH